MDSNHENTAVSSKKLNSNDVKAKKQDERGSNKCINNDVFNVLPVTIEVTENSTGKTIKLIITSLKEVARGSFGTVFEAILKNSKQIAIKKVLQDRRYKNRELDIMKKLNHNHITSLLHFYYSINSNGDQQFLNLIMEFIPQTLSRVLRFYSRNHSYLPMNYAKIYVFQLFRGLNYMHQLDICHRDIKPQNILIDPSRILLRICDFGSAKKLISTEKNVAYICSRYYRAPELMFGATKYTVAIDIWSAGCVFAEILLNKPIFPGESSVDQIVEVIKILGIPTTENVKDMNPDYESYTLPEIEPCPFEQIFTNPDIPEEALLLLRLTLLYSPNYRINSLNVLIHPFFDTLRNPDFKISSKQIPPPLFDFNDIELGNADLAIQKILRIKLHN